MTRQMMYAVYLTDYNGGHPAVVHDAGCSIVAQDDAPWPVIAETRAVSADAECAVCHRTIRQGPPKDTVRVEREAGMRAGDGGGTVQG